jgi:hypothetical protein
VTFYASPIVTSVCNSGHFQRLTQLRIFKNRLRSLPPQIGDLPALQILWLQDNLLTTLPPEIEKLSNLTLLSLKGNPLKVLPVELSRLKKVRDLEMTTDNVTFPPPAISRSGTRKVMEFLRCSCCCLSLRIVTYRHPLSGMRKVMEFLRRADNAWQTNVFDLSDMELDILPLDVITLFPQVMMRNRLQIVCNFSGMYISCTPYGMFGVPVTCSNSTANSIYHPYYM